jgi:cell surface protein SprA
MVVAVLPLFSWLTVATPLGARVRAQVGRGALARLLAMPPPPDSTAGDTSRYAPSRRPKPALTDRYGDPFSNPTGGTPMQLTSPDNVKVKVVVDDSLRYFDITERVGDTLNYRPPSRMSYKQYSEWQQQQAARNYFRSKAAGLDGESITTTKRLIPKIYLPPALERIFGGNFVDIRPNGAVTIRAGYRHNRNFNPALPLRQQSVGDFDFDQTIQLNMIGQVGEKLKLNFNYDTKANFNFENQIKYDYTGSETDIIKKIEAGNVSMPLQGSLIQGGQNLFGAKVQTQFGRLTATAVAATVQGTQDEIRIQNGAQTRKFEIRVDQYDRDRHYYLGQFFRDRYDAALRQLPLINSGIQIRRLEVYITNTSTLTADNLRNVVTLMDLAEPKTVSDFGRRFLRPSTPVASSNTANDLFNVAVTNGVRGQNTVDTYLAGQGLLKGRDFEHIRARKLDPREYKFNAQLGTISLNSTLLPDQVLGVAFEYSFNGRTYKVGELAEDYANVGQDQVIFLKMLKATNPSLKFPTWDLMMKNVYSLNASQVTRDNFLLNIVYKDDETGVNITSLKEGGARVQDIPLIQVMGLDRVNPNNDRPSDGNFDFFPGTTIDPDNGRVYFPVVEPFGSYLRDQILNASPPGTQTQVDKYVFQQLYDSVQTQASQFTQYTKFFLTGRMQQSASDEVQLPGIRVVPGSVSVYSGGTRLTEGVDYQVFYDLARLKVLNPSYLNSAAELRINVEKDAIIQVQPRRLVGTRLDYKVSNDLTVGGTLMHMIENPLINRVNVGDEPTNNTIYGLDVNLRKESRFLTKMIDALPLVQTKELSAITFQGEFAQLIPGKSQLRGENGVSYLDDFENAETPYSLGGTGTGAWKMASPPQGPPGVRNATQPGRASSFNRARLAWYNVDQTYYATTSQKPDNIGAADLKNHYTRGITQREIYPNRDPSLQNGYEFPLDLAYFPDERGPYNYTPSVTTDGVGLTTPSAQNWAGISRGITFDTDFDNANVEYLEFWLLDPFIDSPNGHIDDNSGRRPVKSNTTGGTLYLNLGNISEDVVKDAARYEFENGLPPDGSATNTTETPFGRSTNLSYLTDAFDTSPGARSNQDVGLDGLKDDGERTFFGDATKPGSTTQTAAIYANVADPSADNFRHHLDEGFTAADVKLLGRYKYYNGLEGNSPENSTRAAYIFPDKEDLNRDNVVNDVEAYHEYEIPLKPNQLEVGSGYIVDKVENSINGDRVTWYLFRVPIRSPTRSVNGYSGFKNIRFMRLYMTGWSEPVVLRMNQMRFVANQWRKYNEPITDSDEPQGGSRFDADAFTVSAVNIENNGAVAANEIPYVLPPGIQRDKDVSSQLNRRLNEQSLQLCIDGLKKGFGKAVWKNTAIDLLIYKRLRMFVHAQSADPVENPVPPKALRLFIRIGQDYSLNYYEYSLPLLITNPGETDPNEIWKQGNLIDLALQDLVNAKAQRNAVGAPINRPFTVSVPGDGDDRRVTVIGNPDYSDVQSIMIGVLNPSQGSTGGDEPRSVCVWVDELRVFDYDKTAGWAAIARLNAKLADVATVTATGSYTTYGFGALQTKVAQRARENTAQFDVNANVQGDKFLPRSLNLRVPVGLQYGTVIKEPRFDPLDPDTELKKSLEKFNETTAPGKVDETRAEYRSKVIDRVTTRSINLLNVRKERGPAPGTTPDPAKAAAPAVPHPWDIENFAVSYAYTERLQTNITTFRDFTKTYTGGVSYAYQANPKSYSPLSTVKVLSSPYFQFLKDFNFTPLPSSFSVRADLDRRYNERFLQRRGSVTELPTPAGIEPVFQKSFYFNRIYDLKWNLTKSLSFDYTATNRGVIDEPDGQINKNQFPDKNQVIWNNLRRLGRTTAFNQVAAITYRLPLDKFPMTDWLSADARYQAGYTWTAISTALRSDTLRLGNTIQNNREQSVNAKADLLKLYNKVKFLKDINNPPKPTAGAGGLDKNGKPIPGAKGAAGKAPTGVGNTRPGTISRRDGKGKEPDKAPAEKAEMTPQLGPDGKPVLGPDGKPVMIAAAGKDGKGGKDAGKPEPDTTKKKPELKLLKGVLRGLMSVRTINGTYTRTDGTLLPGYLPSTSLFGFNQGFTAPTPQFIMGKQYELQSLYELAESRGWYTDSSQYLNTALSSLMTENLTLRANVEPFKNFQIQVDARQTKSRSQEIYFRNEIDTLTGFAYLPLRTAQVQPFISGAYSQSFLSVQTLFEGRGANGRSDAFERFITNRQVIRGQLLEANGLPQSDTSYQNNTQDVLIPAFTRAYQGKTAAGYKAKPFNPFAGLPLPNWRIDYNGLSELPLLKKYFSSVTLSHAYQSTYSIANYTTSALYIREPDGFPTQKANGKVVPYYVINTVTIAERMAPLIGINVKTKKNITARFEYKVERNLALNATNAQVTSIFVQDFVIGGGYTTNRFKLPFKIRGVRQTLTNDLTMRLDLTIRDNETVQRTIVQTRDTASGRSVIVSETSQNQTTNGTRQVQLKPTIDYVLNQRLNLQFYFTRIVSAPKISSSYKNVATTAGIQIRYSLGL